MNKKKVVLIIVILAVILLIGLILLNKNQISYEEENKNYNINYFVEYSQDGKVGVIDKNGKEIINTEYQDVYIPNSEKDVFICLIDDENSKIVNSKNEELFKEYENISAITTYDGMLDFEKEVLKFKKQEKYGLINLDGKIILEAEYDFIDSLKAKPGKLLVEKDGKARCC